MKKFKALASMLCMCTVLAAPMTSFASQPEAATVGPSISVLAAYESWINGTNVILRADSSMVALGQLYYGDKCMIETSPRQKTWEGTLYIYVTMTTGSHAGKSGWVAAAYLV